MKRIKTSVSRYHREIIHAKVDEILSDGDPTEILLVIILLLELRPFFPRKLAKKKEQPKRLP